MVLSTCTRREQIPMVYPSSVCSAPISHLHSLLEKRAPRHKKGFLMWLIISPFTAPFMIVRASCLASEPFLSY